MVILGYVTFYSNSQLCLEMIRYIYICVYIYICSRESSAPPFGKHQLPTLAGSWSDESLFMDTFNTCHSSWFWHNFYPSLEMSPLVNSSMMFWTLILPSVISSLLFPVFLLHPLSNSKLFLLMHHNLKNLTSLCQANRCEVKWSEVKSLSHARLFATPWIVACTKLLRPLDFQGKKYLSGLPFPSPSK